MKIAILGAGAMGCMIGAFAKKGGAEVYFVDPYEAHMKAVQEKGLEIALNDQPPQIIRVDLATTDPEKVGPCDFVVLLVKGMNTSKIMAASMALVGKETTVLTLQNGYGNVDLLRELLPEDQIGQGLLKCSATLVGPGRSFGQARFRESNVSMYFYPVDPNSRLLGSYREFESLMANNTEGFVPELSPETELHIWEKLSTNAMGNIPCALLQVAPQDVVAEEVAYPLYRGIVQEICAVASAKGIPMEFEEHWEKVHVPMIPKKPVTFRTYTSAIHDVSRKMPTECDFLNGAIYKEGQKLGIPTPYNETVWRLMKVLEANYDNRYVPEK